jgi:hypothetical protein
MANVMRLGDFFGWRLPPDGQHTCVPKHPLGGA